MMPCEPAGASARSSARRALLDAQFTLDTISILKRSARRRSAAADQGLRRFEVRRDVPYGPHPAETLDIFPAPGSIGTRSCPGLHPWRILALHGGGGVQFLWHRDSSRSARRSRSSTILSSLPSGWPPSSNPAGAVSFGLSQRAAHELDPERIFVAGNSAGGHLVAELADRSWLRGTRAPSTLVKGATAISGLFDLRPVAASSQNETLQLTEEEVDPFSPLLRPVDIGAPIIVAVGGGGN